MIFLPTTRCNRPRLTICLESILLRRASRHPSEESPSGPRLPIRRVGERARAEERGEEDDLDRFTKQEGISKEKVFGASPQEDLSSRETVFEECRRGDLISLSEEEDEPVVSDCLSERTGVSCHHTRFRIVSKEGFLGQSSSGNHLRIFLFLFKGRGRV